MTETSLTIDENKTSIYFFNLKLSEMGRYLDTRCKQKRTSAIHLMCQVTDVMMKHITGAFKVAATKFKESGDNKWLCMFECW